MDVTFVVAVDREHLAELREVWPTWYRFHPEIAANPLLFLTDGTAEFGDFSDGVENWAIRKITTSDRPTQKDRMLASLLLDTPRLVTTPQWIKIDTDTIAVGPGKPLTAYLGVESLAAPAWPYTIPVDALDKLDSWWQQAREEAATGPLGPQGKKEPERDRVHLSRVIGWLTIIDTAFSRRVAELVHRCPPPFISHDTILWYAAQRWGIPAKPANFKKDGWEHHLGIRSIKRRVAEVMAQAPAIEPRRFNDDVTMATRRPPDGDPLAPAHSRSLDNLLRTHFGGTDKPLVGVEIGVYRGETSSCLLRTYPNLTLFMVDPWREVPASEHAVLRKDRITCAAQSQHDDCRRLAYEATHEFRDRRIIMETTSHAAATMLPASIDFGFIDGRHDRASVEQDISDLWPKIKPGGILTGHDINHRRFTDVTLAVNAFVEANGLKLQVTKRRVWGVAKP